MKYIAKGLTYWQFCPQLVVVFWGNYKVTHIINGLTDSWMVYEEVEPTWQKYDAGGVLW